MFGLTIFLGSLLFGLTILFGLAVLLGLTRLTLLFGLPIIWIFWNYCLNCVFFLDLIIFWLTILLGLTTFREFAIISVDLSIRFSFVGMLLNVEIHVLLVISHVFIVKITLLVCIHISPVLSLAM